jgi:hypothetical protein
VSKTVCFAETWHFLSMHPEAIQYIIILLKFHQFEIYWTPLSIIKLCGFLFPILIAIIPICNFRTHNNLKRERMNSFNRCSSMEISIYLQPFLFLSRLMVTPICYMLMNILVILFTKWSSRYYCLHISICISNVSSIAYAYHDDLLYKCIHGRGTLVYANSV